MLPGIKLNTLNILTLRDATLLGTSAGSPRGGTKVQTILYEQEHLCAFYIENVVSIKRYTTGLWNLSVSSWTSLVHPCRYCRQEKWAHEYYRRSVFAWRIVYEWVSVLNWNDLWCSDSEDEIHGGLNMEKRLRDPCNNSDMKVRGNVKEGSKKKRREERVAWLERLQTLNV